MSSCKWSPISIQQHFSFVLYYAPSHSHMWSMASFLIFWFKNSFYNNFKDLNLHIFPCKFHVNKLNSFLDLCLFWSLMNIMCKYFSSLFALLNSMMKSLSPSYKNILNAHNYEALQCLNCESGVMRIHETLQRQNLEVLKKVVKWLQQELCLNCEAL
jgi:hypothetical protein